MIGQVQQGKIHFLPDIAERLALMGVRGDDPPRAKLDAREMDVFRRLAQGQTIEEIAGDLSLSRKTISLVVQAVKDKLGVQRSADITKLGDPLPHHRDLASPQGQQEREGARCPYRSFLLVLSISRDLASVAARRTEVPRASVGRALTRSAIVAAFVQGFLQATAVVALLLLVVLALCMIRTSHKTMYWVAFALLVLLCLALALHKVPGFNNPIVINGVQFAQDAKPFTKYLNFDKGSVGVVLSRCWRPSSGAAMPRAAWRPRRWWA